MNTRPSVLPRSFDLLNSALVFVFVAFCIDLIFFSSLRDLGPLFYAACLGAKVVLYAGAYGSLIEIISEQYIVISWKRFKENIKAFWKPYLLLTLLAAALQGILQSRTVTVTAVNSDILVSVIMAGLIIKSKYKEQFRLKFKPIRIAAGSFAALLGLYLIDLCIKNIGLLLPFTHTAFANSIALLSIYLHFLTFTLIAVLILDQYPEIASAFDDEHKLYLINPLSGGILSGTFSSFILTYPPVFAILRALSPKAYKKAREFNRHTWRKRYYKPGKLVAITSYTSNIAESYQIAKEFRRHGSKVIMGGPHVTYHPNEALDFCDSVVIGEAEGVWKQVVEDYENDNLQPKYFGPALDDFHSEVHQELLTFPPEVIKDCIEVTRGCKFHCDFCTIPSLSGGRARQKPVHEIVELIEKIKPYYKNINLIDNNIYSDPAYAKELFRALKPLGIHWTSACTIDIAKNDETLLLAKESGCKGFLFGYEIFGGSLEEKQRGKLALAAKYREFTTKIKKMGINIKGTFIFGFDSDSLKNIFNLWRFCFQIYPYFTNLSILTPLPGSRLYHQMIEQNRTTNLNWREYDCHRLVFRQDHLKNIFIQKMLPQVKYFFLLTTSSFGHALLALMVFSLVLGRIPY